MFVEPECWEWETVWFEWLAHPASAKTAMQKSTRFTFIPFFKRSLIAESF